MGLIGYFWTGHVLQLPSRRFLSQTSRFHLTCIDGQLGDGILSSRPQRMSVKYILKLFGTNLGWNDPRVPREGMRELERRDVDERTAQRQRHVGTLRLQHGLDGDIAKDDAGREEAIQDAGRDLNYSRGLVSTVQQRRREIRGLVWGFSG